MKRHTIINIDNRANIFQLLLGERTLVLELNFYYIRIVNIKIDINCIYHNYFIYNVKYNK